MTVYLLDVCMYTCGVAVVSLELCILAMRAPVGEPGCLIDARLLLERTYDLRPLMGIQNKTKLNTSSPGATLVMVPHPDDVKPPCYGIFIFRDSWRGKSAATEPSVVCLAAERAAEVLVDGLLDLNVWPSPFLLSPRSTSSRESDITLMIPAGVAVDGNIKAKRKKKKHATKMQVVHSACVRLVTMSRAAADERQQG